MSDADKKKSYDGVATEYGERFPFDRNKSWGQAHKGPGIRFVCKADALDDADHKGFWVGRRRLDLWPRGFIDLGEGSFYLWRRRFKTPAHRSILKLRVSLQALTRPHSHHIHVGLQRVH